ncbi:MAG: hypothetical protein FJ240_06615 [Nitrospira sp.]|nr:hypothetical protein [Nitrospira sp.]
MMGIILKALASVLTFCFAVLPVLSAYAAEPERPDVNAIFDIEKERKIEEIAGLSPGKAFNRFKDIDFLINDSFLSKAIFKTFHTRKAEGIALALASLSSPVFEQKNGLLTSRTDEMFVSRKTLEVFPEEAASGLWEFYKNGNAMTRGNVIRASGQVAGGKAIADLLISALDDKDFCEVEIDEVPGMPLRICDLAYNQLVLRYKIRNVLRTIGTSYKLETRDYHIAILKDMLQGMPY